MNQMNPFVFKRDTKGNGDYKGEKKMETISLMDGINLTVVSILIVFTVLASIWGLVELVAKFIPKPETLSESSVSSQPQIDTASLSNTLVENSKHKLVAELMALSLASEGQPNKKFEIVESKRVR